MEVVTDAQFMTLVFAKLGERLAILMVAVVIIFIGFKLFDRGVEGSVKIAGDLSKKSLSVENAAPGLVVIIFGAFVLVYGLSLRLEVSIDKNAIKLLYSDAAASKSVQAPASESRASNATSLEPYYDYLKATLANKEIGLELRQRAYQNYSTLFYTYERGPAARAPNTLSAP